MIDVHSDADVNVVHIPANPVSTLSLWIGATKILKKEVLLLFPEIQPPSVDEMVSIFIKLLEMNVNFRY